MKIIIYQSSIKRKVALTHERKKHIFDFHPDFKSYFKNIPAVLKNPDEIRKTYEDTNVLIFYKFYDKILNGKYIAVVVKINKRSFILTSYLTDKIKTGVKYEK